MVLRSDWFMNALRLFYVFHVAKFNLGKVNLQANKVSGLLLKRT